MTQYQIIVTDDAIRINPNIAGVDIAAYPGDGEWVVVDGYGSTHVATTDEAISAVEDAIGYYADDEYTVEVSR